MGGTIGCSSRGTANTTVLLRSAGHPLPIENGRQILIFPIIDLVVEEAAPFIRNENTWQSLAAILADNLHMLFWCSGGIDSSRSEGRANDVANFINPSILGIWSPSMADRNALADTASSYSVLPEWHIQPGEYYLFTSSTIQFLSYSIGTTPYT